VNLFCELLTLWSTVGRDWMERINSPVLFNWRRSYRLLCQSANLAQRQPRGWGWCPNFEYVHSAEKARDTTLDDELDFRNIIECRNNTHQGATYRQTNDVYTMWCARNTSPARSLRFGPRWR